MVAVAKEPAEVQEPCTIHPDARYRGENQLWRVEIHRGGKIGDAVAPPTFKVSFDNGSAVFPVLEAPPPKTSVNEKDPATLTFTVRDLGRDARTTLNEGDWVEFVTDRYALQCGDQGPLGEWSPDPLLQVVNVDRENFKVTVNASHWPRALSPRHGARHNMLLRRWDHQGFAVPPRTNGDDGDGTFAIVDEDAIALPDGIEIRFEQAMGDTAHIYRSGDYWLIPAREASLDIEWDGEYQLPRGIVHYYAPLALVQVVEGTVQDTIDDLRASFTAPSNPSPFAGEAIGVDEL
jgi:hypothetical protein